MSNLPPNLVYRFVLVGALPVLPQLLVSAFNIWYNLTHIYPLLTATQLEAFLKTVQVFNAVVYPLGLLAWLYVLTTLWQGIRRSLIHQPTAAPSGVHPLEKVRRRTVNLPWWAIVIVASGNLLGLPVFIGVLLAVPEPLHPRVLIDLPISLLIGALMSISQVFLLVELLSQRLLYPLVFRETQPTWQEGILSFSLLWRGILLMISNGICPVVALLLLSVSPYRSEQDTVFAIGVAVVSTLFGLSSAWMVSVLVREPVEALRAAALAAAQGNLDQHISLLRADEFGPLIDEFNRMLHELRQKQMIEETFGRHVGRQAALEILQQNPRGDGREQFITVMFADLRNFTQRCTTISPHAAVDLLNQFLTVMVQIVEDQHHGMVNKFLGDGFMAIFGVGQKNAHHAAAAVMAGSDMLLALDTLNQQLLRDNTPPLQMGVGIHTGAAIVGSIGSPQRLEYTAIGDTVNLASRLETLTKTLGIPLLFTASTAAMVTEAVTALPPQRVKGQPEAIALFTLPRFAPQSQP